jgi:hypothetical protein
MKTFIMLIGILLLVLGSFAVPAGIITAIYQGAQGLPVFEALWVGAKVWMIAAGTAVVGAVCMAAAAES